MHGHFLQNNFSAWNREFGANEQGLNSLYLVFFLYSLALAIAWGFGVRMLNGNEGCACSPLHPLVKLLTLVITLYAFGTMCIFIHYAVYAQNGVGSGIRGLGDFLVRLLRCASCLCCLELDQHLCSILLVKFFVQ